MRINARFVATSLAIFLTGTFAAPQLVQPSNGIENASDAIQSTTLGPVSTAAPSPTSTDVSSATSDITQTVGLNTTSTSIEVPMETTSVVSIPVLSSTSGAIAPSTTGSAITPPAASSSTLSDDISSSADVPQSTGLSASGLTSSVSSAPTSIPGDTYNSTVPTQSDTARSTPTPSTKDARQGVIPTPPWAPGQGAIPTPPWAPFTIPGRVNASMGGPPFANPTLPDCPEHPGPREESPANSVEQSSSTGSGVSTSTTTASTGLPSVTNVPQPVTTPVGQCLAFRSSCLPYWIAGSVPCCEGTVCFPVVFGIRGYCV